MKYFYLVLIVSFLSTQIIAQENSFTQSQQQYKVKEKTLFEVGNNERVIDFRVSNDYKHIALLIQKGDKQYVWTKGMRKKYKYDKVHGFNFSPDGSKLAVIGRSINWNGTYYVYYLKITDKRELGAFIEVTSDTVVFSPNSRRYALPVAGQDSQLVVYDNKLGKVYQSLAGPAPTFTRDSKHLVYIAKEENKYFLVKDKKEGPKFDNTEMGPFFSFDNSQIAYGGHIGDDAYIVVNDSMYGPYEDIWDLSFSSTSDNITYSVRVNGTIHHVVNHVVDTTYIRSEYPVFSKEKNRFAYRMYDGDNMYFVVDSIKSKPYANLARPRFSPKGNHWYSADLIDTEKNICNHIVDDSVMLTLEGKKENFYTSFSPDETQVVYQWNEKQDKQFYHAQGITHGPFHLVGEYKFSPDGQHHAVTVGDSEGRNKLILDGKELTKYKMVGPNVDFSPDSKNMAFTSFQGDTLIQASIVINDREFEGYDNILPLKVKFQEDGSIIYYAFSGNKFYKITMKPL